MSESRHGCSIELVSVTSSEVERGYIEGQNLTFEYRTPDGRNESFAELARELVRLNVDVIVTRGTARGARGQGGQCNDSGRDGGGWRSAGHHS